MSGNPFLRDKVLRLILLSCDLSADVIRYYIKKQILQSYKQDFTNFLNAREIKHTVFHLHINRTKCCECKSKRLFKHPQVIKEDQLNIIYSYTGSKPHEVREQITTDKSRVTKHCICFLTPKASLNDLDVSLLSILLKNCCGDFTGRHFINNLVEIRNFVSHLPEIDSLKENDVDKHIELFKNAVRGLSACVSEGIVYYDSVKKQIEYVLLGTYKAADVQKIIDKGTEHSDVNTSKIMAKIEDLKQHTTTLAENIIESGEKNAKIIVGQIEENAAEMTNFHIAEMSQLGNINESQEMLLDNQFVQCETLKKVDVITTDTNEKVTKFNKDFEGLGDGIEKFAEFSESIEIEQEGKTLLTVKRGQGEQNEKETQTETKECHHSGSQTGIECMAFELGNRSTSELKDILLGREKVDNTELKNLLVKDKDQNEIAQKSLDDIKHNVSTLKQAVSEFDNKQKNEIDTHKKLIELTREEIVKSNDKVFATIENLTREVKQGAERTETKRKDLESQQAMTSEALIQLTTPVTESVNELGKSFNDIQRKIDLAAQKTDHLATITQDCLKQANRSREVMTSRLEDKFKSIFDEIIYNRNKNVDDDKFKNFESFQTRSFENFKQKIDEIEIRIDEQGKQQYDSKEVNKLEKENNDLKLHIQQLEDGSLKTLLETAGFTDNEGITEFKEQMVDGTLEKDLVKTLESNLVHFPRVIRLLANIYQEWLNKENENYPSICCIINGKSIFLVDYCRTCRDHFNAIRINIDKIGTIVEQLWSLLRELMSQIKSKRFQLVLEALPEVIASICGVSTKIEDHAIDNRKRASVFEQEINKFIQSDVWMEPLTEIASTCMEIFRFFQTFENVVSSICSKSADLKSRRQHVARSQCPKYQYLMTDIMCKEACCLFQEVVWVKVLISCYMEMSDVYLMKMIETLDQVISKPEEECKRMDLTSLKECERDVADIPRNHRSRMRDLLGKIF